MGAILNCGAKRKDAKITKLIVYLGTEIKIIYGQFEEIESQTIINLDLNPMLSNIRNDTFSIVQKKADLQLAQLSLNKFYLEEIVDDKTNQQKYLINIKINEKLKSEDLDQIILNMLRFLHEKQFIVQILIPDDFINQQLFLSYHQYSKIVIKSIVRFLDQVEDSLIKQIILLCKNEVNFDIISSVLVDLDKEMNLTHKEVERIQQQLTITGNQVTWEKEIQERKQQELPSNRHSMSDGHSQILSFSQDQIQEDDQEDCINEQLFQTEQKMHSNQFISSPKNNP